MDSRDDSEKREAHTRLIKAHLENSFPQASEVRAVRDPETLAEVLHVDFEAAESQYRLRVARAVLEDSRPDSEIVRVVERAVALMKDHPRRQVTLSSGLSLSVVDAPG